MKISLTSYQKYINSLYANFIGEQLYSPILLNNETLIFPFEKIRNHYLVLSLNNNDPLLYIIKNEEFFSGFETHKFLKFKKIIGKSILKDLTISSNDFIVEIKLQNIESNNNITLVAELVSKKPDLLILENSIITESFLGKHTINEKYEYPRKSPEFSTDIAVKDEDFAVHFQNQIVIRKKQKYSAFEKFLNSKIKAINKKISQIENDVLVANENLKCEEFANEIFTTGLNLKGHYDSLCLSNGCIKLDESKTLLENIEKLYKKSKKAKETIKRAETNLSNAKNELYQFTQIKNQFDNSSEKDADKIVDLYGQKNKKKEVAETIFNRPYFINLNGTYFYFGRNASQNDYLSFVMKLDREFTWLHIKDLSGSHIVICNKKPTENELLFACEIALICSKVSSAEVVYTKKKNVRRGHTLGEAILKNHSTIKINNVRKESIDKFALAKRVN